MNQIRSNLTRLKTKIEEKLSDGNDLFGYSGVSKSALIQFIERAYDLTGRIEELRGGFCIVSLKRKLETHFSNCKEFLDTTVGTKKERDNFNVFLDSLSYIHDEIALAHTIYCSDSIRSEAELEKIILNLKNISSEYEKSSPIITET